ncbi:hypothetical protein GIB67_015176 [Kingdonia uniflora]|uniref:DUF7650 domain-containing protein n=1 Tax=Kingdonia uniflora TaxID=39325 RepID=A0A7J7LJI5_9MAGN|nr:hypothetical protein GIB67_015176 [Kingdonia uniflora]
MFTEDKVSLEEYVSTLKGAVGISVLVEAVGIGKGKQDLIEPAKYQLVKSEPAKRVQNIPRPKVPVGNAWSSLTLENIIKFLTGDVRLSKSRSNDLFFEAVWPRLLERGWVSEKPKNCSYTSSKHSVVFLIPGVKKFSRKLVKGDDYFDSVMDVLNKVALEPGLIELEDEKNSVTEENGLCIDTKFDSDAEHSKDQRRSYLQPRLSNQNLNHMKFTVVDTSLDQEEDEISVRMLRSLPAETTTDTSSSTSLSSETDGSCEDPVDGLDASNMLLNDEVNTKIFSPSKSNFEGVLPGYGISISNGEVPVNELPTTTVPMDNDKDQQDASISAYTAKIIKCQFRLREKFAPSSYLSPTKRQRLTASSDEDSSGTTNYLLPDVNENMSSKVGISHDKVSTSSSSKGSPDDIIVEKFQTRALIDLNLPPIPLDFEAYESLTTEVEDEQSFQPNANQQPLSEDSNIANDVASAEILSVVTARRQGTRNRPLTTKALEALACGFLTPKPKRRRRGMGTIPPETSI